MSIAPFTPKPLSEFETDVRMASLHMALNFVSLEDDAMFDAADVVVVAEVFRKFLMGLPIASEG